MDDKTDDKKFCPTCGQKMNHLKDKEIEIDDVKPFKRFEIWNCLNCSEEWQIEITKNILRKNAIIDE